jgi:hypothetical protein
MTFADLLSDIEGLKGKKLRSIRPGAEITVEDVDRSQDRVIVLTADGHRKTRPFSEIQYLWECLSTSAAVHVDSALGGSGSSRNQPESILANLPYIEWLNIGGRKHIAFVGHQTHDSGTLKQMDGVRAENLKKRLSESVETTDLSTVIVVASDILKAAQNLEAATGLPVEALDSGLYKRDHSGSRLLLVAASSLPPAIEPGTYAVIRSKSIPTGANSIQIGDQTLYPVTRGGMNIMLLASLGSA